MKATEARISVDSCVFVNVLIDGEPQNPTWLPAGKRLLQAAERGQFRVVISALTIAEVVGIGKIRGSQLALDDRYARTKAARQWMRSSGFRVVELDRRLAMLAAEVSIRHQLRGPDAVVLVSALQSKSSALYTWDSDLLKLDGAEEGLRILTPDRAPVREDLFDAVGT